MKYVPSVIVGSMSGKAGPVVFSRWKGQPYIRQHVVPSNPNTDAQQAQRAYFSQIVSWWHQLAALMVTFCDALVEGEALSGFNAFMTQNVKDLVDAVDPRIIPTSSDIVAVESFVATTGASGIITCAWNAGDAVGSSHMYFFACPYPEDVLTGEIFKPTYSETLVSDEAVSLSDLEAATAYQIFGIVESADSEYSPAVADDATSGA